MQGLSHGLVLPLMITYSYEIEDAAQSKMKIE